MTFTDEQLEGLMITFADARATDPRFCSGGIREIIRGAGYTVAEAMTTGIPAAALKDDFYGQQVIAYKLAKLAGET